MWQGKGKNGRGRYGRGGKRRGGGEYKGKVCVGGVLKLVKWGEDKLRGERIDGRDVGGAENVGEKVSIRRKYVWGNIKIIVGVGEDKLKEGRE